MTKIEVKNVSKSFGGKKVLDDVSFTIESGDFTSILGPTNAGKSTLLKIIAGVENPDSGQILFDGVDVTKYPPQKRNIGVIFQNFALYPNLTVFDNIASPLKAKNIPKDKIEMRVTEQARILKIDALLKKRPNELSGGEAQRTALARALVKDAAVYLLDEPLTNLDYKLKESMKIELKKILQTKRATIIYATPSPEEALVFANTVVFLYNGHVVQTGGVRECYTAPSNIIAAQICSTPPMNLIDTKVVSKGNKDFLDFEGKLELDVTHLNLPKDEKEFVVGVYPFNLYLNPKGGNSIAIPVELELQEMAGSEMTVRIRWNNSSLVMYVPFERELESSFKMYLDPTDLFIYSKQTGKLITKYKKSGA